MKRFVLLQMLGRRQLGAKEMGRLIEDFYGVEPNRWYDESGILENLIGGCSRRCGIAVGDDVMDLFHLDIEFRDVEIDSE